MKKITKEMIEEMSDADLLSLMLKQFEGLEYLFQQMCARTVCREFAKLTNHEDQFLKQKNFNKEVLMQSQKIIFKNKLDIEVFDKNFYNIIFERLLSLHKKS